MCHCSYLSGNEIGDLPDDIFPEDNMLEILWVPRTRLQRTYAFLRWTNAQPIKAKVTLNLAWGLTLIPTCTVMIIVCIAMHCIVLYWNGLNSIVFCCIVIFCIVLTDCILLWNMWTFIVLHYICIALYCIVVCCIVLYCIPLFCIVLYCIVLYAIIVLWNMWTILRERLR